MPRNVKAEQFLLVAEPLAQGKIGHAVRLRRAVHFLPRAPSARACRAANPARHRDRGPARSPAPARRRSASSNSARFGPKSSHAPHFTRLSTSFLFMPRDSTREQRSCMSRNGPPFSRAAMICCTAAWPTFLIAESPKRIVFSLDGENAAALVHVGREHRDAHRLRLGDEKRDLVGVVEFVGEQRGHELDRVPRLQPRRLAGDHAVAGRVRLVETVARRIYRERRKAGSPCPSMLFFFAQPSTKIARCFAISSGFFLPIARRSMSAPPSV